MADRVFITPKVLKWARESARMSEETAAAKVLVAIYKFKEWEQGTSQPTIRQAEILAKAYRRPLALLFLPEIPFDFTPLQDFRSKNAKPLSTSSIFIIREIQQKQAWIRDVYEESNEKELPFVGRYSIKDNPIQVARDILDTLAINPTSYQTAYPIKEWIDKAESLGIFVSRTSFIHSRLKLDSDEIQGFAIADPYSPFIFINSDDWDAPQLFTFVHELAHIWIAESGISNEVESDFKDKNMRHPIELFCNEVAANALIPLDIMRGINMSVFDSARDVFKLSRTLGVSTFAFILRALNLNLISFDKYRRIKHEAELEFKAFLIREEERKAKQKEQKGGPSYYLLQLNKNGRLFTQVVLDAFKGGILEASLASSLLNTQVNNFQKLEAQMYR